MWNQTQQVVTHSRVEKYLLKTKANGTAGLLDRAFLVMMDPHTGEVLSMSGKKLEKRLKFVASEKNTN